MSLHISDRVSQAVLQNLPEEQVRGHLAPVSPKHLEIRLHLFSLGSKSFTSERTAHTNSAALTMVIVVDLRHCCSSPLQSSKPERNPKKASESYLAPSMYSPLTYSPSSGGAGTASASSKGITLKPKLSVSMGIWYLRAWFCSAPAHQSGRNFCQRTEAAVNGDSS